MGFVKNENVNAEYFNEGDILVVPASGFLTEPAFFKVVSNMSRNVRLRALGTSAADKDGKHVPDMTGEYYDSICARKYGRISRFDTVEVAYASTWCGKAYAWDGNPC